MSRPALKLNKAKSRVSKSTQRRRNEDAELERLYHNAFPTDQLATIQREVLQRTLGSPSQPRISTEAANPTAPPDPIPTLPHDASPRPPSIDHHRAALHAELKTLVGINETLGDARAALPLIGQSLKFQRDPRTSGIYTRQRFEGSVTANSGPYSLRLDEDNNQLTLKFESTLIHLLGVLTSPGALSHPDVNSFRNELLCRVQRDLECLDLMKRDEWERQQQGIPSIREGGEHTVDTKYIFASSWAIWSTRDVVLHTIYLVTLVMHLLEGLTRRASELLLAGLHATVSVTLQYARGSEGLSHQDTLLIDDVHRDPRRVLTRYNLEPILDSYTCCPACFALYPITSTPSLCSYRSVPTSPACQAKLLRTRTVGGKQLTSPVRTYLHQPMRHWLGRLVCRPGIETSFIVPDMEEIIHPPLTKRDFWHGSALRSFLGPDNCKLYVDAPQGETRLIFSLAVDGFNPYQSKTAKQKVTSTAIYMVCLNLPPHLRYLPENMYLVGVVPGPTKPSLDQLNHFLRLLVNDLLPFWNPGISYTRTDKHADGHLYLAAIVPVVCDVLAARQVSGLGSHSSTFFCTFCYLPLDQIELFVPAAWPKRDLEEHRRRAKDWRDATSIIERENLFELYGIRWSELLRLPYWDPIRYTVVDSMHNLYLGLLKNHCREVWGINPDVDDGDASAHPTKKPPPFPSNLEWERGLDALYHGPDSDLLKCKKAVLWHLCDRRDLRRAGTVKQLARVLISWRTRSGLPQPRNAATATAVPIATHIPSTSNSNHAVIEPTVSEDFKNEVEKAERSLARAKAARTLTNRKKDVLLAMCATRSIPTAGATVPMLAERLWEWKQTANAVTAAGSAEDGEVMSERSRFALGRQSMEAFREIREAMQLPSWISPAPRGFGTSEHGKLSADQWHTACTVVLPVALIWLWGTSDDRKVHMLNNFMDLVSAVVLAGLLETSDHHIDLYQVYMLRYLEGLKELYQEATIKQNHHYALHIPDFMDLFFPVHSWRSFAFERYNYMLQTLNTNLTFGELLFDRVCSHTRHAEKTYLGELESTFMKTSCRAANLRPLLNDPRIGPVFSNFMKVYNKHSGEDERGLRLDAILRSQKSEPSRPPSPTDSDKTVKLSDQQYSTLLTMLNDETPHSFVDNRTDSNFGSRKLTRKIQPLSKVLLSGIYYRPISSSSKDCNILFAPPTPRGLDGVSSLSYAGVIQDIFVHSRTLPDGRHISEVFLHVAQFSELSQDDQSRDPFRRFPIAGGRLVYAELHIRTVIIRSSQVICHIAKTPLNLDGIQDACLHILPLDRMLRFMKIQERTYEECG